MSIERKKVADEAKVSQAVLSRVLNGKPGVSEELRKRVYDAYFRLYKVQPPRGSVGFVIPDPCNPYFTDLAFRMVREFAAHSMKVLIASSEGSVEREIEVVTELRRANVNGLILVASGAGSDTLHTLLAEGSPAVVLDRGLRSSTLDFVAVDTRPGIEEAVAHLVQAGHRRIGFIHGLADTQSASERFESFKSVMATADLTVDEGCVFPGDYTRDAGRTVAQQLSAMPPHTRPTAIMTANDLMAIGLMQQLQSIGWQLPRDLSVIGFDDIGCCQWVHPSLTSVAQPVAEIARYAAELLVARIEEKLGRGRKGRLQPSQGKSILLKPRLVVRASVTAPTTPRLAALA